MNNIRYVYPVQRVDQSSNQPSMVQINHPIAYRFAASSTQAIRMQGAIPYSVLTPAQQATIIRCPVPGQDNSGNQISSLSSYIITTSPQNLTVPIRTNSVHSSLIPNNSKFAWVGPVPNYQNKPVSHQLITSQHPKTKIKNLVHGSETNNQFEPSQVNLSSKQKPSTSRQTTMQNSTPAQLSVEELAKFVAILNNPALTITPVNVVSSNDSSEKDPNANFKKTRTSLDGTSSQNSTNGGRKCTTRAKSDNNHSDRIASTSSDFGDRVQVMEPHPKSLSKLQLLTPKVDMRISNDIQDQMCGISNMSVNKSNQLIMPGISGIKLVVNNTQFTKTPNNIQVSNDPYPIQSIPCKGKPGVRLNRQSFKEKNEPIFKSADKFQFVDPGNLPSVPVSIPVTGPSQSSKNSISSQLLRHIAHHRGSASQGKNQPISYSMPMPVPIQMSSTSSISRSIPQISMPKKKLVAPLFPKLLAPTYIPASELDPNLEDSDSKDTSIPGLENSILFTHEQQRQLLEKLELDPSTINHSFNHIQNRDDNQLNYQERDFESDANEILRTMIMQNVSQSQCHNLNLENDKNLDQMIIDDDETEDQGQNQDEVFGNRLPSIVRVMLIEEEERILKLNEERYIYANTVVNDDRDDFNFSPDKLFIDRPKRIMSKIDMMIEKKKRRRFEKIANQPIFGSTFSSARGGPHKDVILPNSHQSQLSSLIMGPDPDVIPYESDSEVSTDDEIEYDHHDVIQNHPPFEEKLTRSKINYLRGIGLLTKTELNHLQIERCSKRLQHRVNRNSDAGFYSMDGKFKTLFKFLCNSNLRGSLLSLFNFATNVDPKSMPDLECLDRQASRVKLEYLRKLGLNKRPNRSTYRNKRQSDVSNTPVAIPTPIIASALTGNLLVEKNPKEAKICIHQNSQTTPIDCATTQSTDKTDTKLSIIRSENLTANNTSKVAKNVFNTKQRPGNVSVNPIVGNYSDPTDDKSLNQTNQPKSISTVKQRGRKNNQIGISSTKNTPVKQIKLVERKKLSRPAITKPEFMKSLGLVMCKPLIAGSS